MFNGRRQPSPGGTRRTTRECQVRLYERPGSASAAKRTEAVRQGLSDSAPRLLRLDVELLGESAPLLLLFADDLRGALGCTAASVDKPSVRSRCSTSGPLR